jgi:hypothetical protein
MKIIIIDTSRNSSSSKVKAFLSHHSDADRVFSFDHMYREYASVDDLGKELSQQPEDFFSKPCAYYDMLVSILGKVRKSAPDTVLVFSPETDDCSRLSNEEHFDAFILHYEKYNCGSLDISYSSLDLLPSIRHTRSPLKELMSHFPLFSWNIFGINDDSDDYTDDFYSAG